MYQWIYRIMRKYSNFSASWGYRCELFFEQIGQWILVNVLLTWPKNEFWLSKRKRSDWHSSKYHKHWTEEQLENGIFSDESKLQRFLMRQHYVRRSLRNMMKNIPYKLKHPSSLMCLEQLVYISRTLGQLWIVKSIWNCFRIT